MGVGVGPAATSQTQFVFVVQDGLRQTLPVHVNPDAQSLVALQLLLQLAFAGCGVEVGPPCCGVGVGVGVAVGPGVGVGVGVAVGPGVEVGVGVGVAMAKASVQAGAAAFGVTWGTVGATGLVVVNFPLVRNTMTAKPIVKRLMNIRCQYFFKAFINLLPYTIVKYFRFDGKTGYAGRNSERSCILTAAIQCC